MSDNSSSSSFQGAGASRIDPGRSRGQPSFFADVLSHLKDLKITEHSRKTSEAKSARFNDKKSDTHRGAPRGRARGAKATSSKRTGASSNASTTAAVPSPAPAPPEDEFWTHLLQQLVSQSYPDSSLGKEDAASIIVLIAELLPRNVDELALQFCEFMVNILRKQEVAFHVSAELDEIVSFLLPLIVTLSERGPEGSTLLQIEALKALSFLVFERGWLLIGKFGKLIETLLPLVDETKFERDVLRMAVNCLGNLCAKTGNKAASFYPQIFNVLSLKFSKFSSDILAHSQQQHLGKTISSILRALQLVTLEGKMLHEAQLPSLISSLTKLMYYGTSNLPLPPPPTGNPTDSSGSVSSARTSPASSEYSGSDANGGDRFNAWKVRLHALGCLQSLAKCSGQKLVPFWPSLLPQSSQQPSVCSILHLDPVHQVRSGACALLSVILDGQKSFLQQTVIEQGSSASGSAPSSFTPMSSRLGIMIREIHNSLCKAIDNENRPNTLVQIIKCVVVVVTNTPYENMQRGLLSSLTNRLLKLYNSHPHSSTSTADSILAMQRAALSCLAAVISAVSKDPPPSSSSSKVAQTKNASEEVFELIKTSIISQVITELSGNAPLPLQPELLRVLGAISGSFFDLVFAVWKDVFSIVLKAVAASVEAPESLAADPAVVRLNAVKVIEEATAAVLSKVEGDSSISSTFSQMWHELIHSPLLNMTTDRSSQVRSSMCNILSQIPGPIFASLKPATRIMCVTLMLGATRDDSPVVRAQACRTLGVYILNSSLNIDPIFVTDVAQNLVEAMKDPNLNVRIRACWSVANLCDALVALRDVQNDEDSTLTEEIPRDALILIAKCALVAAKDNDKVRSNAVRALGNFTRFASNKLFSQEDNTLVLFDSIINILTEDTREGSAKVRWNACYALGNLFKNESILEFSKSSVSTAMDTLLQLLSTASNFKIRINACVALASPSSLDYYGDRLPKLWQVILDCLNSLDALEDVASFQYKDSLHEQLIRVTLHLVELYGRATKLNEIEQHFEKLVDLWTAFWKKLQSPFFRRPKPSADDGPSSATGYVSNTMFMSCLNSIWKVSPSVPGVAELIADLSSGTNWTPSTV